MVFKSNYCSSRSQSCWIWNNPRLKCLCTPENEDARWLVLFFNDFFCCIYKQSLGGRLHFKCIQAFQSRLEPRGSERHRARYKERETWGRNETRAAVVLWGWQSFNVIKMLSSPLLKFLSFRKDRSSAPGVHPPPARWKQTDLGCWWWALPEKRGSSLWTEDGMADDLKKVPFRFNVRLEPESWAPSKSSRLWRYGGDSMSNAFLFSKLADEESSKLGESGWQIWGRGYSTSAYGQKEMTWPRAGSL